MTKLFHFRKFGVAKAALVVAGVAFSILLSPAVSGQQVAVDPTAVVCFPSCKPTDARFLVVAGNDPTTFAAVDVLVGVSAPLDSTSLHFGIFDGDTDTNWDKRVTSTPPPPLEVELWADPDRDGPTGPNAVLLKTYTPGVDGSIPFANNAWADVFENHAAVDPNGIAVTSFAFRYTLRFRALLPAENKGWNAFKLRTMGTLSVFAETFAFLGAYTHAIDRATVYPFYSSSINVGPSTYDGNWTFGFSVPADVNAFDVWDGDFDFGNCSGVVDDDDPNTPNEVPFFATGTSARAEGVGRALSTDVGTQLCTSESSAGLSAGLYPTGLPMDDNGSLVFERVPGTLAPGGVAYEVVGPTGVHYVKSNPSGQREWERLTVGDGTTALPTGVYAVNVEGMDLSNLNFWRFSYGALGLPPNGPPAGEDAFYRIGRLVWYDTNSDEIPDADEPVIPGVAVTVTDQFGGVQTAVTDTDGEFTFRKPAGSYTVVVNNSNFAGPLAGLRSTTGGETVEGLEVGPTDLPAYDEAIFGYVRNTPPVADTDGGLYLCSSSTTIDVLANDTDVNNDTLTVTAVSAPTSGGTATLNANGTVTYTPTPGYLGADSFTYTISDGWGGTAIGTVTVEVINNLAVLLNDSATTNYQTPVTVAVLANDSDPDGQPLTVASATNGANGTTTVNLNGTITYTPNAGFSGTDQFTYTVTDGCGTVTATVIITVNAPPPPPPPPTCSFRTQTQGGWGSRPNGSNPGSLLAANFSAVFGSGVTIGSGTMTLTFTSATAVRNFLPAGGTPGVLTASGTNVLRSSAGVFAGQVLALTVSAGMSNAGVTASGLADLPVASGPMAGYTVAQVLAMANTALSGGATSFPVSTLNSVVDAINNNFVDGTKNLGYLVTGGCPLR